MQNDSYNRGGFIAFLFSMVFSLGFFIYIVGIHPGVDLKEVAPTTGPEQTIATKPLKDVDVSKIDKPWVKSDDMAMHGQKVFGNVCAVCHGSKGLGDGPAGMSLNPKPRNLKEGKWKQGGDSISLYKTLQAGIPGSSMASFAHLPAIDRWGLVQYIRSITDNAGADDDAKLEAFAKDAK